MPQSSHCCLMNTRASPFNKLGIFPKKFLGSPHLSPHDYTGPYPRDLCRSVNFSRTCRTILFILASRSPCQLPYQGDCTGMLFCSTLTGFTQCWFTRAKLPRATTGPTSTAPTTGRGSSSTTSWSRRPPGKSWRRRVSEAITTRVHTA